MGWKSWQYMHDTYITKPCPKTNIKISVKHACLSIPVMLEVLCQDQFRLSCTHILSFICRYVVRAKAGKKQSSKDASGRAAHSAGASLRRYNELALKKVFYSKLYCFACQFFISMLANCCFAPWCSEIN